jgi:hypothetical protein
MAKEKKGTAYVPKIKDFIYLDYFEKGLIERLRQPYGQMIATCYFEKEIIMWVLSDQKRVDDFFKDFNDRHKQQINDMNIELPKIVITDIQKTTEFICPFCLRGYTNIKEQRQHIINCSDNPANKVKSEKND